ncbi:MAG TPA: DinB family protein [Thermoanaerobaculia bacterium]|jgi:uncharacterized damage-inducible protein DinB|nr:DinB family protein [Thermoanaerobaculia bacterium]
MSISQALLPEFDQEMAGTRKTLERIPMDKYDWTPHTKSFNMGKLATHVATLPGWASMTVQTDELDLSQPFEQPQPKTNEELLAIFDQSSSEARNAIAGVSDEQLMKPWTLRMGDKVIFTMPKIAVIRGMVMNHIIHHRAQLTVYLRLNDIPVPGLYGPSADENLFG